MRMTSAIWENIYTAISNMRSTELIHRVNPLKIILEDLSKNIKERFTITERNLHLIEKKIKEENIALKNIHLTLEKEKNERKKKTKLMKNRIMIMGEIKLKLQERLEKETEELHMMEKTLRIHKITERLFSPFRETIQDETNDNEKGKKTTTLIIYESSV
ncbi:uncharacterized protein LOC143770048 [Ranitomeya variabilis]|uniref:uncharacterized protein LOC143770048 n=1 Tax=Ranitomeya variabilis TaxID=490064 RepID=UPI0040562A61